VLDHYLHTVRAASLQLYPARDLSAVAAPRPDAAPESFASGQDARAGWYGSLLGHHHQALVYCQRALELHHELGNHDGEADACDGLSGLKRRWR